MRQVNSFFRSSIDLAAVHIVRILQSQSLKSFFWLLLFTLYFFGGLIMKAPFFSVIQLLRPLLNRVRYIYELIYRPFDLAQSATSAPGNISIFSDRGRSYALIGSPDVLKLLTNHAQWNLQRHKTYFDEELSPAQELIPGFLQLSDGRFHRTLRTLGSAQYTPSKLLDYTRVLFTNYTESLAAIHTARVSNLRMFIQKIVYKTVCADTFGICLDSQQIKYLVKGRRISSAAQQFYKVLGSPVTSWLSPLACSYRDLYRKNNKMLSDLLIGSRGCPVSSSFFASVDTFNSNKGTNPLGDKQLLDELHGYLAASESVPITVEFVLYILLLCPGLLEKVRDEASLVFLQGQNCTPNVNDLTFTRSVVLETLRLYPPFPFIERDVCEQLILNDHCIAPRTKLIISIYSIHRNEEFHESAHDFLPERWSNNSWGRDPDLRFLPFGFGHTKCIAWEQSLISISLLVARITLDFDVKLSVSLPDANPSNIPIVFEGVNIRPKHPLLLYLR